MHAHSTQPGYLLCILAFRLSIGLSSSEFVQNDQRFVRNPMVIARTSQGQGGPAGCAKRLE
eukprot:13395442-Heterocapsa_arctica.AAC.1